VKLVGEFLLFTIAAQLTTLPIILYYFQRLSLISLLANPLILPAQPPVMILGGLSTMLGLIYLPLGSLASYLAWPFLLYTIRLVELLAQVQGAATTLGRVSLPVVLLFYVLLFGYTWWRSGPKGWIKTRLGEVRSRVFSSLSLFTNLFRPPVGNSPSQLGVLLNRFAPILLLVLASLTVVVWQWVLSVPDGRLHLTVFNVGSGDGILIQTPTGRSLLIDGGPSPNLLSDALGRRLPFGLRGDRRGAVGGLTTRGGAIPSIEGVVVWTTGRR
jgi:competence protein ComEC